MMSLLNYSYLVDALRFVAKMKCRKSNCGTVCLCEACAARRVLPIIESSRATMVSGNNVFDTLVTHK